MKIQHKISLTFAGFISVVLFFSFLIVYFWSVHFIDRDFDNQLLEKATLTAWKYFEKDEMAGNVYEKVLDQHKMSLPDAQEIVLDTKNSGMVRDSLSKFLTAAQMDRLLAGKDSKFDHNDARGVGIYYPDNQGNFVVVISAVNRYGHQQKLNLLRVLLAIFLGSIFLILLVGQFYASRVMAPISVILSNVRDIRSTSLSKRLKESTGNDELAELTRTFNQMLERLEETFLLQKNFIHNASHELKNPLTAIMGETEIALSRSRTAGEYVVTLERIRLEADRLDQLTRNLLSFASADFNLEGLKMEEIRMDDLVQELKDYFELADFRGRLRLHFGELPESARLITTLGVHELIRIAIMNVVHNACKFSGEKKVDLTLSTVGATIHLEIRDEGVGIPAEERNSLFQPFFRASNVITYKGSGIGLSLAQKLIALHGGNLRLTSEIGKGTLAEIDLPSLDSLKP